MDYHGEEHKAHRVGHFGLLCQLPPKDHGTDDLGGDGLEDVGAAADTVSDLVCDGKGCDVVCDGKGWDVVCDVM